MPDLPSLPYRSRAREIVLQMLFQDDVNPLEATDAIHQFLVSRLQSKELVDFATSLLSGVRRNREELDEMLNRTAENWTVERMAATDRNVLRLGAYEMLYTDTPNLVCVNEAVELAKRFGTAQSAQFVNGILDKLLRQNKKT